MSDPSLRNARIASVVAATILALACGTNYAYSAWGPAFAQRMVLSSTQQNLIGVFGNIGMYGLGIPVGILVDRKGPKAGAIFGLFTVAPGYYALYRAYVGGPGSMPLEIVCMFTLLTGCGGASAFSGAVKTSTVNWPKNRGTATAFPIAAFGLSAFFFSSVSSIAFPNDTAGLLLFLCIGTFLMIAIPIFFLRIIPNASSYTALPTEQPLQKLEEPVSKTQLSGEPGTKYNDWNSSQSSLVSQDDHELAALKMTKLNTEDSPTATGDSHDVEDGTKLEMVDHAHSSLYADVRGLSLLRTPEFYQQFMLLGCMTGIGLMTINNIGNDAEALWLHKDADTTLQWIRGRQAMHVSLISLGSASGRLLSGIGSDLIVKRNMSRLWCLIISGCLFCLAQTMALILTDPNFLFLVSGITGLAYGFLFGVFPSIVAETWGVAGMSQNWGCMTLAPIIFGNIFNMLYGVIFDSHSHVLDTGHVECLEGRECYREAYVLTFVASLVSIAVGLWSIRVGWVKKETMAGRRKGRRAVEVGVSEHLA